MKNLLLIVEFTNKLQINQCMSKREEVVEVAVRLRPILMIAASLAVAMVPLLTA